VWAARAPGLDGSTVASWCAPHVDHLTGVNEATRVRYRHYIANDIAMSTRRRSHALFGEPGLEVVAGVSDKQDRPDVLLRSGIALQLLHDLLALIRRRVEETTQYRPRTR
jgi:hypothetical protein